MFKTRKAQQEALRLSRNDARRNRFVVEMRSHQKCEVCQFDCRHIAQIHHIIPANKGGLGIPKNLILLCPNCHAIVEKLKTQNYFEIAFWVSRNYPREHYALLWAISVERAYLENDKWTYPPGEKLP